MRPDQNYEIKVESGSFFGTEEYRRHKGWNDLRHNEERIVEFFEPLNQFAFQINTSFDWEDGLINGSQAGIYYFLDPMNWIKFVKEKLSKGVFLVLAYQIDGLPMVSGKIFVPSGNNCVCLKLNLLPDNTVSAEYRFSEEGDWHDMVRGIGWKQTSELVGDEPRDTHLSLNDEKGKDRALIHFPVIGAKFKLITEQWKLGANEIISFKRIRI